MSQVLIYVRGNHSVEEYCFFSRELSPVLMDYQEVGLTLLYDTKTKHTHLCLLKLDPSSKNYNDDNQKKESSDNNKTSGSTKSQNDQCVVKGNCGNSDYQSPGNLMRVSFSDIVPVKEATLQFDAHLVSCVCCELKRSRIFRRRFLKFVARNFGFKLFIVPTSVTISHVYEFFDSVVLVPYVVKLVLLYPRQKIDYAWNYRMWSQMAKRVMFDDAMNWLSTLGGGYSSLGDYFQHHAEEAGRISLQQLKLSEEMGDPLNSARCKLFYAQSLMQRGYIRKCKQIVRAQGYFCRSLLVSDDKLMALYKSLKWRLKHLKNNVVTIS
ncbi:uncharacterized protein LOC110445142 [Mizuhopecten yessoensis]|uniref:uncharacterized protein LOC110445142 n=1 Tax=Mizuhopecten yessoensis TaxID=6573 RepID=UPI000B45BDDD|nr:uncharacterized protein LOC110445142 [Mizuhopecten yessoensis]